IPSLDDLARAQGERKWPSGIDRTIELLASGEPSCVMDFYRLSFFGGWSCPQLYVPVLEARWSLRRVSSDFCRCGGIRTRRGGFLSGTTLRQDKSGNQCEGYQQRALGHELSPDFGLLSSIPSKRFLNLKWAMKPHVVTFPNQDF